MKYERVASKNTNSGRVGLINEGRNWSGGYKNSRSRVITIKRTKKVMETSPACRSINEGKNVILLSTCCQIIDLV